MLNKIINAIKQQKHIYIITHVNPDGDALGSAFGLKHILLQLGIDSDVVLCESVPHTFSFMNWQPVLYNDSLISDCVVGVDFGELERCGICGNLFKKAKTQIIIDHHIDDMPICDLFYTSPSDAATGQIIYDIAGLLNIKLTKEFAESLYTAVMTDTGGCRYSNTTRKTHLILADLIEYTDNAYLCRMLFELITPRKFKIQQHLLNEIEFYNNGLISVITAKKEYCSDEDILNGLGNIALNIEGAKVGILFKERTHNEIKISLRTLGSINASKICKVFGGGGHMNASGCTINEPLAIAKKLFIDKVTELM